MPKQRTTRWPVGRVRGLSRSCSSTADSERGPVCVGEAGSERVDRYIRAAVSRSVMWGGRRMTRSETIWTERSGGVSHSGRVSSTSCWRRRLKSGPGATSWKGTSSRREDAELRREAFSRMDDATVRRLVWSERDVSEAWCEPLASRPTRNEKPSGVNRMVILSLAI